ncbi:hypothetical protein [Sphaerisporangium sp. NPDC051011]|uniref:hypothetical protein n=1 Tax=Sphaerisporangium sp. NPDC051011 TaxID=3155792 RepID=UPI0033D42278
MQLAVAIVQAILSAGVEAGAWRTLWDLQIAAGVYVKSQPAGDADAEQINLF